MKYFKNIILASLLGTSALTVTSCRDDFSEVNTDPSQIVKAEPSYLFAHSVLDFEPCGYTYWFYNAPMMYNWNQMAVPTGSFRERIVTTTVAGAQGGQYISTLKYVRDLDNYRSNLSQEESDKYAQVAACMDVITAYLGIFDIDMYGDVPFTEACRAAYGGTLTPGYDKVEDLFELWLKQLNDAIVSFTTAQNQTFTGSQDIVYGGDMAKWAKLANSLKLRIAARLISQDKAKAISIAQEVANAPSGYIDNLEDAMLFNKVLTTTGHDDNIYHWSNGFMDGNAASQRVMNFMLENKDPRVRFCYDKNQWNSTIVQYFYDMNRSIPAHIEANVEFVTENGKKKFVSWKGMGEPWVRYYGLPTAYDAASNAGLYGDYFNYSNLYKIGDSEGANQKDYITYSMFQRQMVIGRTYNFTMPTVPAGPVIQKTDSRPWYGLYLGGAETNLYLAEFKLLGASLPQSAESYYNRGMELSVKEYDRLAELNQVAYYGTTYGYDPHEVSIDLKNGEIEAMMESADYQLTGSLDEQLEKVYLQQMLNFTLYPNEQFVTSRRSGLPKFNSKFISRENFATIPVTRIPRRFDTGTPVETDLMYSIKMGSYQSQGFTVTSAGSSQSDKLNSERVWHDKGAPQWGEGPKN